MSVSVNYLKKLSDKELLKYIDKNNIYTSEATLLAVDILKKERNYTFSQEELQTIEQVVAFKIQREKEFDIRYNEDYIVEDTLENQHFPKIESKPYVLSISAFFSVIVGAYLISQNLKELKLNSKSNVRKLVASTIFASIVILSLLIIYHFYGYDYMLEYEKSEQSYRRYRITADNTYLILYVILNWFFTLVIWSDYISPELKYRAKNDLSKK